MAARIAEVELEKLAEEQALVVNQDQDTVVTGLESPQPTSDRGKTVVVEPTPPASPVRTLREFGTPSSTITPEMRAVFDGMQAKITQLKDGMQSQQTDLAENKADNKAKDEKMDQILFFLKDLVERLPTKP
jgi:hypothetical protein